MTSQHKRTFSNSLFCCSLLPTLRSKFPHFLCTVCKIVVCSQHSFQFKKFNSPSASVLTAADLHSEFPQQILKCIAQCCKILFHYQRRKNIKFLGYFIVCGNEISIWLTLKSFYYNITNGVSSKQLIDNFLSKVLILFW